MNVTNQNISSSKFNDVNMDGTTFTNVCLSNAKFQSINLAKSRFHDINFSDVTFTAAQIGGTIFKHIGPPPDKDGKQARQRPVTFEEMMLCDSVFRRVDLSNVQITECNITGMKINGILVSDLLDAYNRQKL
jgi:uncharacterized protein YjbI with pentapeptide repeats